LSFARPLPEKSFSVAQINKILGRIYSIAFLAIMGEALVNGFVTIEYLVPEIFFGAVAVVAILTIGLLVSQWFYSGDTRWLLAISIAALFGLLSWPLQLRQGVDLPDDFTPWIWWTLGISSVAAATTFRFSVGVIYLAAIPIVWFFLKWGLDPDSSGLIRALQDSLHVFTFTSVLVAMVLALRWQAGKVDSANQLAINSAVESARVEAIELERSRIDALVHDSVLTTLLIASRSFSEAEISLAQKSATDAIKRLQDAASETSQNEELSLVSFLKALELRIREIAPEIEVIVSEVNNLPIDSRSATALTEATLQAVDNSLKHALSATKRSVRLRGHKNGLKIVVSDNGFGFRPSRVPKDRLGIRTSIVGRVEQVGGRVFLDSKLGTGTNVVIEWGQLD
jgi:signal transduction histidine kinase